MRRRQPGQSGFVLVVVLMLLAILVVLASSAALSSRRAVEDALAEQDRFQSELDQASTRETLLFMLATHRATPGGLSVVYLKPDIRELDRDETELLPQGNEIALDGRAHEGLGQARFALQDDRGLISVNWAPPAVRAAFYAKLGAPAIEWPGLEQKRLDFQDADRLRRLDGAEEDEYLEANLPAPTNQHLASPLELRRIPQWAELLAPLDDSQILQTLSISRSVDFNLNTAPAQVLAALPGMNPVEAERLVALRRLAPLLSIYEIQKAFPLAPGMEELLNLFPNNSGNLTLWDRLSGTMRHCHWTLTPLGDTATPWRIDYEVTLPRGNQTDQPVAGPPQTPLFAAPDPPRQ